MVLLGFVVSAMVSFVVVKWLLHYVQSHTFSIFGWYRIFLGAVLFAILIIG
jgi:undecaprenyl-diphosphatase